MNPGEFDEMRRGQPRRLTPEQVGELLGKSTRTLYSWRKNGEGPAHVKIGKKSIMYDEPVVLAWLEDQRRSANVGKCPQCGASVLQVGRKGSGGRA